MKFWTAPSIIATTMLLMAAPALAQTNDNAAVEGVMLDGFCHQLNHRVRDTQADLHDEYSNVQPAACPPGSNPKFRRSW
jgi:hypothetical protein